MRHTCHVKSRSLGLYLKHLDDDLFMHMFVSHACGGGPRTLTHAITTDTPIRCPLVVYHLRWRAREGFDQRWIHLSPCFGEYHGEITDESLGACVHASAHCTSCEPPFFLICEGAT